MEDRTAAVTMVDAAVGIAQLQLELPNKKKCEACAKMISKTNWSKHKRHCAGKVIVSTTQAERSKKHYHNHRTEILAARKMKRQESVTQEARQSYRLFESACILLSSLK
jgi:hypothetical protein